MFVFLNSRTEEWNWITFHQFCYKYSTKFEVVSLNEIVCFYFGYLYHLFKYNQVTMEESASILNLGDVEINWFFKDLIPKRKENLYVNRSSYLVYQLHNNVWSFIAEQKVFNCEDLLLLYSWCRHDFLPS